MIRQVFLNGKLVLLGEENLQQSRDVFVNFCTPNIFSGGDLLREIHELAGPSLETECRRFCGLGSGGCRLTDTFEARQFKKIAHCILPAPKQTHKPLSEIEFYDFSIAYRNALDMSAESGYKTIAFTHPYFYAHKMVALIAVATIKRWLDVSAYSNQMDEIVIMCGSEELMHLYIEIITSVNDELNDLLSEVFCNIPEQINVPDFAEAVSFKLFDSLMQAPEFDASFNNPIYYNGGHYPTTNQYCIERYGFDEAYIHENSEQLYDELFKTMDGLQLQLSRNLSATILSIEEETGLLRQYRMTTQNREGDTCYFRCSRCESLMKQSNSEYRPKITVKSGFIFGDCYPEHHPECYPMTKEAVILQQMDREARLSLIKPYPMENFKSEMYNDDGYDNFIIENEDWKHNRAKQSAFERVPVQDYIYDQSYLNTKTVGIRPFVSTSINNTLQAIRKCETELEEDYDFCDSRIRDEDFTRVMVGDLQNNTFLHDNFNEKINDENEFSRNNVANEEGTKVDNEASELDVAINDLNANFDDKSAALSIANIVNADNQIEEYTEEEYPRQTRTINLSNSNIIYGGIPSYTENEAVYADSVETEVAEEQQLGMKCRKYRIIRERRKTNVAFDWRNEENASSSRVKENLSKLSMPKFNDTKINNNLVKSQSFNFSNNLNNEDQELKKV